MNNFSPLPASASDSRLSSPEAVAPNALSPMLQARRQKLRRIVAWVVGGATLLMCAGLVRSAFQAHSAAVETAALLSAQAPVPSAPVASASALMDPAAATASAAPATSSPTPAVAAKPAKKLAASHAKLAAKTKHAIVAHH
jgi:hypothetical protein